jgi:hypothetical protein
MSGKLLTTTWVLLALSIIGTAIAVVQRPPVIGPAWASENGEKGKP